MVSVQWEPDTEIRLLSDLCDLLSDWLLSDLLLPNCLLGQSGFCHHCNRAAKHLVETEKTHTKEIPNNCPAVA